MKARIDRTAAVAAVLQIALLASCGLDSSGIVSDRYYFTIVATIQSEDGRRMVVSSDNLAEFAASEDTPVFGDLRESSLDPSDRWYRSYLKMVTDARRDDPEFQDVYGHGPWCVVQVQATPTDLIVEDPDVLYAGSDPLPTCACTSNCDNEPPRAGALAIHPTTAARPEVVDFGTVPLGEPRTLLVTLENTGDGNLCLNPPGVDASWSANPDDFSVVPSFGCTPSLDTVIVDPDAPDPSCQFFATFTPRGAGPRSARVPTLRYCGAYLTLEGVGAGGTLTASPAPVCFNGGETCTIQVIRIDNMSTAAVTLSGTSLTDAQPDGWELQRLYRPDLTPVTLPHTLGAGGTLLMEVRACALATEESALRVMHDGSDYGAAGSPTGDVDSGSPLVVRLLPRSSGCTP